MKKRCSNKKVKKKKTRKTTIQIGKENWKRINDI